MNDKGYICLVMLSMKIIQNIVTTFSCHNRRSGDVLGCGWSLSVSKVNVGAG